MIDRFGRTIEYLRVSVTDKCNLRCKYCMPEGGVKLLDHKDILTLEEIDRIVSIMSRLDIKKVRFTGGEPLVRKNLESLIKSVSSRGIDTRLTTNGILLSEKLDTLIEAGLKGINISIDTLNRDRFLWLTGVDGFEKVYDSLQKSVKSGLNVKVNSVLMKGFNDDEIEKIAAISKEYPVDVRFIELMPIGVGRNYEGVSSDDVLKRLENTFGVPKQIEYNRMDGPAKYVQFDGFLGKTGVISPLSHTFCGDCNRVRLTSDGYFKLCLNYSEGIDLKSLIRSEKNDDEIESIINNAIMSKPEKHNFSERLAGKNEESSNVANKGKVNLEYKKMVQIGG